MKQQQQAAAEAEEKERNEWTQVYYTSMCTGMCFKKNFCVMQSLHELRCMMRSKFDCSDCSDTGVKIAFKLPDGSKNEYKFPSHSTVKVSM